jgi:hypothetical protein
MRFQYERGTGNQTVEAIKRWEYKRYDIRTRVNCIWQHDRTHILTKSLNAIKLRVGIFKKWGTDIAIALGKREQ